jgi:hypothetical protein
MYLHIGNDKVVRLQDIIGVFDIETSSISKITRDFLNNAQINGNIYNVTNELPKSFIVCSNSKEKGNYGKYIVYISQISSITLLKRLNNSDDLNFTN